VTAGRVGDAPVLSGAPLVVDLSSLWAGPLCARLLRQRGATVVKVESWRRPDGARRGPAAFFDLMHAGARSVALDFTTAAGRDALRSLVAHADVVIEASRPRALQQLGIDAPALLGEGGPRVWVSITGYGRDRDRVAFGDDAAAAGGLVAWDEHGPCFAADAIADPLAGVAAAAAVTRSLAGGGRWLLDVSMARVAAHVIGAEAGRPWRPGTEGGAAEPRPARAVGVAPSLGADNAVVAAELGIGLP
jgi:crotonobetainyl-CoA:carnitine CoA-transferase CaiB-like acyl-CoA transferase